MECDGAVPQLDQLVDRHLSALYRFAYRLSGNRADAEDLVQETFLIARQKLHQLRDPGQALSWLFRVLRSCWSKQCRRRAAHPTVPVEEIAEESRDDYGALEEFDTERLLAVLDQMPDEYREPLLLFYFEEFRYREIAEALDCPIGTVMSRLARAKSYLRSKLSVERIAEHGR